MTGTSDSTVLDLLRLDGAMTVAQVARETSVTATAVRQRLNRLIGSGLVERRIEHHGRGRPSHHYSLTERGVREAGNNYGDLAIALWRAVRSVDDPQVRRDIVDRIADALAADYADKVRGRSLTEKMLSLGRLFADRGIPCRVDQDAETPVLTTLACPYPDLAGGDRSVCSMERMLISKLLGQRFTLSGCRLDGDTCCTFQPT